ncbi:hypothetical protein Lal_00001510 [Lupinus albus]|nr:hypothetical protein Lal_00001510 [Lupinus albus]
MLAMVDGGELTARRTAATSAFAAKYLARKDAEEMLMVGTGRLALNLIEAHAVHRPLKRIRIWGRSQQKAEELSAQAAALGFQTEVVTNLASAVHSADIISCATLSSEPLIRANG